MKALTFCRFGDPEVLEYIDVEDPDARDGELLVATRAIGLNYSDLERRRGHYPVVGRAPYIAGYEAAGVVVSAPAGSGFRAGDRVAVTDVPRANAELMAVPLTHAIPLPDAVSFELAAASLLQGLTAHYLVHDSHRVLPGEVVVVHAASGGVGQFLTQFAVSLGASVVGLTTREAKKDLVRARGASQVWRLDEPWQKAIVESTQGRGADVVYDSVGTTLNESLATTRVGGAVVLYGSSGGSVPPVDGRLLMDSSKTVTGGDLWGYLTSADERIRRSGELFDLLLSRRIVVSEPTVFSLREGRQAHEYLESGRSTGKVVLTV